MGLGDLVLGTLKSAIDYIVELADDFGDVIKRGMRKFLYSILSDDLEIIEDVYDGLFENCPQVNELWKNEKENIKSGKTGAFQLLGLVASSAIGTGIGMGLSGFSQDIQNYFNVLHPVKPLSPEECAYYLNRNPTDAEKVELWLKQNGYDIDKHHWLLQMYSPKLTITEIITAYLRGVFDEKQLDYLLSTHGLSQRDIDYIKEIMWIYPSPTDFIRFAVRDVFTTDQKTKEALSAEFPEDIVDYAKKAGMREDVLKWYWMAHWELPSPTQVYEMLHRLNPEVLEKRGDAYKDMGLDVEQLKTDLETVKFYLKQADYDKRWRERLLAISYSPLTRVDLRRIYELGLIDDDELVARLMEVGYTKTDALKLLEFYKSLKVSEEKDLTRSQILELFKIGEITEEECKSMLMEIGYDEVEADFLIAIEKYKENERIVNDLVSVYTTQFVEGLINEDELIQKLDELGLRASRRDKIITDAVRKKNRSIRLPSKEDILKWYRNKQITEEKARELLSRINIPEEFHDLYLGKKMK